MKLGIKSRLQNSDKPERPPLLGTSSSEAWQKAGWSWRPPSHGRSLALAGPDGARGAVQAGCQARSP